MKSLKQILNSTKRFLGTSLLVGAFTVNPFLTENVQSQNLESKVAAVEDTIFHVGNLAEKNISLNKGIFSNTDQKTLYPGIMLTFDDSSVNQWYDILPILDKYNVKATFFVSNIDSIDDIKLQKLIEMYHSGHEIGAHGFYHLNALEYLEAHTDEEYINTEILPLLNYFSKTSIVIHSFAYPFGANTSHTDSLLLNYFEILRKTTYSFDNLDVKDNNNCYIYPDNINNNIIKGIGIDHIYNNDFNELSEAILKAKNENLILVFYSHTPSYNQEPYTIRPSFLDSLLHYAYSLDMSFYKVCDINSSKPLIVFGDEDLNDEINSDKYALNQNYPNPFNEATTIQYNLPENTKVSLDIYNLNGQKVKTLVDKLQDKGIYDINFNASDLPSGIYFSRLKTKYGVKTEKMMLVK